MFEIYKGKTVFITGHTGFKGSWLSQFLLTLGAKVFGYSHRAYKHYSELHLDESKNHIAFYGDIRDSGELFYAMKEANPDIIFHLAAQPIVKYSHYNPQYTYDVNIQGTIQICETLRNFRDIAFVCITTDKVYQQQSNHQIFKESDPLGSGDPYSTSKACVELIIDSYRQSYFKDSGISCATARAGNVLGGGDWELSRLVPDLIYAFFNRQPFVLRNPNSVRPWQHVLDVIFGYLLLGEKLLQRIPSFETSWNFGPEPTQTTTYEVIQLCIKYWSELSSIVDASSTADSFHEAPYLQLDSSKANNELNWHPLYPLEIAIEKTISWYKEYYQSTRLITQLQIGDYISSRITNER